MMESGKVAKQVVGFQRTLFENSFSAMTLVQDQTEKMVSTFMSQIPWVPEEGKKSVTNSVEVYKKARADFKKAVDDGFNKLEELFSGGK